MHWSRRTLLRTIPALALALPWPARAFAGSGPAGSVPPTLLATRWLDSAQNVVTLEQLGGRPVVLTLSYTACRRTCSTTLLVMTQLQRELDQLGVEAQFVIVTLDPANDTPAQWQQYRRQRGLERENWHFLSGALPQTRRLARLLDLEFWDYHGHVMHDFRIMLYDPAWKLVSQIEWSDTERAAQAARALAGTANRS